MAWYYFSGKTVKSIRVCSTKSVAVRPNTKVEVLEVTREVQALINQGMLRKTGRPRDAKSMDGAPPRPEVRMQDVLARSALATFCAEKGVTPAKGMPPTKAVGQPEFTVHELEVAGKVVAATPDAADVLPAAGAADVANAAEKDGKKWSKRRRDQ